MSLHLALAGGGGGGGNTVVGWVLQALRHRLREEERG